ncbi:MAG TPA: hypothetical protein VFB21_22350 [Chthonomonadaceae bacterium]|jgi:hypothetical protein|nr:hypothetical protein [Chthonomonadaceae bacterium]
MKLKGMFAAAILAALLFAGTAGAKAQSSPNSIAYVGRDVAILRTTAGYPSVLSRINRFYERMVDTFTDFHGTMRRSDFHIVALPNGERNIMARNRLILTVTNADARSYRTSTSELARRWLRGFAATLPQAQPMPSAF